MRCALVVLVACRFEPGSLVIDDAAPTADDARADARPIDAPPVDARNCPAPPTGCTSFTCPSTSSCYYLCGTTGGTKATWFGAKGSCEGTSINGCIVTVNSQEEQNCIVAASAPTYSTYVWIGYRQDPALQSHDEPDGDWGWQCPPSTYVQPGWGTSSQEPNEDGSEDCAALTAGGAWFDASCGGTARYVCEVP